MAHLKERKAELKLRLKQKLIVDTLNKILKPLEKIYAALRNFSIKTKERFPVIYKYFEEF